jgi:hypothetical protein
MDAELVHLTRTVPLRLAAVALLASLGLAGCGSSGRSDAQCRTAVPTAAPAASLRDQPPPVPRSGAYLGAFALNGTNDFSQPAYRAATAALETQICRRLDIVHTYLQWQHPFPVESQRAASRAGQILLLSWTGTDLERMASGAADAEIRQVAAGVASLRSPVFVELRWEMERPNLASVVHSPRTFIAAWDHTRALFAQAGVTNASWVWCPTATGFDRGTAPAYYPGRDQVDWICTDAYPAPGPTVVPLSKELTAFLAWTTNQGKPLMLGEFGVPANYTADQRSGWLHDAADFVKQTPAIKAVVYFDYNPAGRSAERQWLLRPGSKAMRAFAALGADPWFHPAPGS